MNALRYSAFYLLGGLVATLAQVTAGPGSAVPSLGASGAIAAVMGAFLVTYPRARIRALLVIFIFVRITFTPAALLIGVWFLIQLFSVGTVATSSPAALHTWLMSAAWSLVLLQPWSLPKNGASPASVSPCPAAAD